MTLALEKVVDNRQRIELIWWSIYCLYKSATISSQVTLLSFLLSSNANNMKRAREHRVQSQRDAEGENVACGWESFYFWNRGVVESRYISAHFFAFFLFYFGERKLGDSTDKYYLQITHYKFILFFIFFNAFQLS